MNFVIVIQSQGALKSCTSPFSFLVYFTINFTKYISIHSVNMVDGIAEVISNPESLEVIHTIFYSHTSLKLRISLVKTNLKYWQNLTILQAQKPMPVR